MFICIYVYVYIYIYASRRQLQHAQACYTLLSSCKSEVVSWCSFLVASTPTLQCSSSAVMFQVFNLPTEHPWKKKVQKNIPTDQAGRDLDICLKLPQKPPNSVWAFCPPSNRGSSVSVEKYNPARIAKKTMAMTKKMRQLNDEFISTLKDRRNDHFQHGKKSF